jgi:sugar lactone lactonase YvrE
MVSKAAVDCVLESGSELAEGPVWHPDERALYWVNIKAHEIHRFDPATGQDIHWQTPADVGSLGLRKHGGMVVALRSGFFFFDPPAGFRPIVEPEADNPDNRFNDGKTDRQGRFWAGTLYDPDESKPTGGLYRLATDLSCQRLVDGIFASNGLAFSPDSKTAYYADSTQRLVWAFDFDADDGALSNRRVFVELKGDEGGPDGAAIDSEGCYWLTQPSGWRVVRYDPRGRADRIIEMPVSQPTCCAFGGPRMDTLYITTARYKLSAAQLAKEPLAGHMFALNPGVGGPADAFFAGDPALL